MVHKSIRNLALHVIIIAFAGTEFTRFDKCLALSGSQENISSSTSLYHAPSNIVMFMLITILLQFRMVKVKFKMRPNLITYFF